LNPQTVSKKPKKFVTYCYSNSLIFFINELKIVNIQFLLQINQIERYVFLYVVKKIPLQIIYLQRYYDFKSDPEGVTITVSGKGLAYGSATISTVAESATALSTN